MGLDISFLNFKGCLLIKGFEIVCLFGLNQTATNLFSLSSIYYKAYYTLRNKENFQSKQKIPYYILFLFSKT